MRRVVRRLRPTRNFCLGEHESWFTDMAAEGLHLKRIGWYFAKFVPGEPEEMKYRVDVCYNRSMTKEIIQMYKENGWDYVTRDRYSVVFSSPVQRNATELHTDPGEQAYTIKALDKKFVGDNILTFFCVVFMLMMLLITAFRRETPIIELVSSHFMTAAIQSTFYLVLAWEYLWAAISIRKLRKDLIEGKPANHNAPWKKYRRVTVTLAAIYTIVFSCLCINFVILCFDLKTKPLPLVSTQLPIVRLADIEQNHKLIFSDSKNREDSEDVYSSYSYERSIFSPVQYESNESGMVHNQGKDHLEESYLPSIFTKVYKLTFPSMAKGLALELQESCGVISSKENSVTINDTTLDYVVVFQKGSVIEVCAVKGKGVIFVSYSGTSHVNTIIKEIEKKMNLISK